MNEPTEDDMIATVIAAAATVSHEAVRAWQLAACGATNLPPWPQASMQEKHVSVDMTLHLARNLSLTAEEIHDQWVSDMRQRGWRHGPRVDPDRKTHSSMRPYRELPEPMRVQDELKIGVIKVILSRMLRPEATHRYLSALDNGTDDFMSRGVH